MSRWRIIQDLMAGFSNFFIFQPLSSEPALKVPWTVWRIQVLKSISFEWPSLSLESFTFYKSFTFTFGPSIDNWTIFPISSNLSPSWRESCRSWWVVCPKNSESQYLSSTLFVSSFQKRRQISISDVCYVIHKLIKQYNIPIRFSHVISQNIFHMVSYSMICHILIAFSVRFGCLEALIGTGWQHFHKGYHLAHCTLVLIPT